jgi:hypothetical protein
MLTTFWIMIMFLLINDFVLFVLFLIQVGNVMNGKFMI